MPMDIEGALWAYAHKDEYPDMGRRAEAAIREAFAIATIVRNPGDAIRAFVEQHPRRADLPWYVRGLARQFCEFVLERAGVEVPYHIPAKEKLSPAGNVFYFKPLHRKRDYGSMEP